MRTMRKINIHNIPATAKLQDPFQNIFTNIEGVKNNNSLIGIIATDKTGKGTTWNQLLYSLSELGIPVFGVPFPQYDSIEGFTIEIMHSIKAMKQNAPKKLKEFVRTLSFVREQDAFAYSADRAKTAAMITNHMNKGYLVITKRSSKATHCAYQGYFNKFEHNDIAALERFIEDPSILIQLNVEDNRVTNFREKGTAVLDLYEEKPQKAITRIQREYIYNPDIVGASYGITIPAKDSVIRLDDILTKLEIIFKHNPKIVKSINYQNGKAELNTLGAQEPAYDLRTTEGIQHFFDNFGAKEYLQMVAGWNYQKHRNEKGSHEIYKQLFINPNNGKADSYALKLFNEVNEVVKAHKETFNKIFKKK